MMITTILCEICGDYAVKEIDGFSFCKEDYLWFIKNVNPYQVSTIWGNEVKEIKNLK